MSVAVALVILLIVGAFGVILAAALVAVMVESLIEGYRKHFAIEGEYMRTRKMLDKEGRRHFDEAMESLKIEGVEHEKVDEGEAEPPTFYIDAKEEKGREKKRGDGPLGGYY